MSKVDFPYLDVIGCPHCGHTCMSAGAGCTWLVDPALGRKDPDLTLLPDFLSS